MSRRSGREKLRFVIVKTSQGHQVRSEKGKNLSAPDLSKSEAKDRLAQVERFKNLDKWGAKYASTRGKVRSK